MIRTRDCFLLLSVFFLFCLVPSFSRVIRIDGDGIGSRREDSSTTPPAIFNDIAIDNEHPPEHARRGLRLYEFLPNSPRWRRPLPMTLTYSVSPTGLPDYLDGGDIGTALSRAFARWSAASSGNINFIQTADFETADIQVGFFRGDHGDGTPFDGPGNIVAHASWPEQTPSSIHFDADERWTLSGDCYGNCVNLESAAMHEIGHVLGLDHSNNEMAIMYAYTYVSERKVELTNDDIQGLKDLYASYSNPPFQYCIGSTSTECFFTTVGLIILGVLIVFLFILAVVVSLRWLICG